MGELRFLLRKVAAQKEKEHREWKVTNLENNIIPHLEHELKTVKELGLEYVSVQNRLRETLRTYKELTGKDYNTLY